MGQVKYCRHKFIQYIFEWAAHVLTVVFGFIIFHFQKSVFESTFLMYFSKPKVKEGIIKGTVRRYFLML